MQAGARTVGDGMRRHIITLERERRNLEQAVQLCSLLKGREEPLGELDAGRILEEMEKLEQTGTTFQNKQRQDIRSRYLAPVVVSVGMVLLMAAVLGLMLWAFVMDPAEAPPLALMVVLVLLPVGMILGTLLALGQRIKEIRKGEMDDARQY